MATFVIVHGAFGGGWEWREVAQLLRERGHAVSTPTLTGLGERAHLNGPYITLRTHVEDIVAHIVSEDLDDIILCAASYGGVPATGAADRVSERIRLLVYIDALVPRNDATALDLLPAGAAALIQLAAPGRPWLVPVPDAVLPRKEGVLAENWQRYVSRLGPQPRATFTEAVTLTGAVDKLPRAFLSCTRADLGDALGRPAAPFARRAREEGWLYHELPLPHDPHLYDPAGTAAALHRLASDEAARGDQRPLA